MPSSMDRFEEVWIIGKVPRSDSGLGSGLLIARSHTLIYFAAAYYLTGHFNPDHEFRTHPETPQDLTPEASKETWRLAQQRAPEQRSGD